MPDTVKTKYKTKRRSPSYATRKKARIGPLGFREYLSPRELSYSSVTQRPHEQVMSEKKGNF